MPKARPHRSISDKLKEAISSPYFQGLSALVGLIAAIASDNLIIRLPALLILFGFLFALRSEAERFVKYLVAWLTWKFALGIMVGVLVMGILIAYLTGLVPTSKPDCPYTGDSDSSTIANIIQAEADAASNEDISIILKIFDPNATIRFAGDGTEWHDPVAYYRDIFKDIEVNDAVHFAIQPTGKGISNDTAWFISGSSGFWAPNGEELSYYYNEPGKDTWVLKKNRSGCWVIVEYGYH